jgi:hypothetical protein
MQSGTGVCVRLNLFYTTTWGGGKKSKSKSRSEFVTFLMVPSIGREADKPVKNETPTTITFTIISVPTHGVKK